MFGRRYSPDAAYLRSQATVTLPFRPSAVARGITLRLVGASDDHRERRRLGQLLVDELNSDAGLTRCQLTVADRPQVHHHDGQRLQSKTYGYYNCTFADGAVTGARARVAWGRTRKWRFPAWVDARRAYCRAAGVSVRPSSSCIPRRNQRSACGLLPLRSSSTECLK